MKRRSTINKLLTLMSICLCSSGYSEYPYVLNDNASAGANDKFESVTVLSNGGYSSSLYVGDGSKLEANNVSIYVESTGYGATLVVNGGSFSANSLTMTGSGAEGNDAYLDLMGGTSVIGSLISYGSIYVGVNGGNVTFGNVNLGTGSHFSAGYSGPNAYDTTASMTLNGTIKTDTFTIGANLTSIALGDSLLNQSVNGSIEVFKYQLVSPNLDPATDHDVLDTILYAEKLLKEAIYDYNLSADKSYDLSNAKVVVHYDTANMRGPGSITIEGVQSIPEPSSATLGILGLSALLLRRKRRD